MLRDREPSGGETVDDVKGVICYWEEERSTAKCIMSKIGDTGIVMKEEIKSVKHDDADVRETGNKTSFTSSTAPKMTCVIYEEELTCEGSFGIPEPEELEGPGPGPEEMSKAERKRFFKELGLSGKKVRKTGSKAEVAFLSKEEEPFRHLS